MPKVTRLEIMKLTSAKDSNEKEYGEDNWRSLNVGGQGLLIFAESLHKYPGHTFLTFYFTKEIDEKMAPFLDDLRTSYGEIVQDDDECIVFQTRNSTYRFEYKGVTLTDTFQKALLAYGGDLVCRMKEKEAQRKQLI